MSENKFEIQDAFSFGWETFKDNIGFFIILVILIFIISSIPQLVTLMGEESAILMLLGGLLSVIVGVILQMGIIKMMLKFVDGDVPQFSELWSNTRHFFPFLITAIIVSILVFLGLLVLIIPGIIIAIMFQFATYTIIDKNYGIGDALTASKNMTKGSRMNLFIFGIAIMILNLIGALILIIGLFVTIPMTMLAVAWVYRQLERKADTAVHANPTDSAID